MGLRFACMNIKLDKWSLSRIIIKLRETCPRRQRKDWEEQQCSQRRLNCFIESRE